MRDTPRSVMMFAAGFGTRMKHLTKDQPKPLVKVAGRPLIDHALDLTQAISPDVVVANLHYLPDLLKAHLQGSGVQTIHETPDILETGGGLRNALPLLGQGPVYTMNTDAIWHGSNPLILAQTAWDPEKMDALLVCVPLARTVGHSGRGDFSIDSQGHLTRAGTFVFGGVQIIKTDLLHTVPDTSFSLNIVWNQMLEQRRIFGVVYDGQWCDVGRPEGIELAERMIGSPHV